MQPSISKDAEPGTKVGEQVCKPCGNAVFLQRIARPRRALPFASGQNADSWRKTRTPVADRWQWDCSTSSLRSFDSLRASLQKGINRLNSEAAFCPCKLRVNLYIGSTAG